MQLGNHVLVVSAPSSDAKTELSPDVICTALIPTPLQDKFPGGGRLGGRESSSLMGFHLPVSSTQSDGRGSNDAQSPGSFWLHSPLLCSTAL